MKKRLIKRQLYLPLPKSALTPEEIRVASVIAEVQAELEDTIQEIERGHRFFVDNDRRGY